MIPQISKSSRNTEVNSVCSNVSTAFEKANLTSYTVLTGLMTQIKDKNASLTGAIKRMREKSHLIELDNFRDDNTRALWYLTYGLTYHPVEEVSSAAKKVFSVLKNFGLQIIRESYSIESANLDALIFQLSGEELSAALAKLDGCPTLLNQLKEAQTNFEHNQIEFEKIKGNEGTFEKASALSKELMDLINSKLIVYLNGKLIDDEETYGDYIRTVEQIISDNNLNIRKRSGKKIKEA